MKEPLGKYVAEFVGGGTPATKQGNYWGGDIPWMTSAFITSRYVSDGQKYITREGLDKSATHLVPKGNLIVATRVGIGKMAINQIDMAISQDLTGLILNEDLVVADYLYWVLLFNREKLLSLAQGSTIKGLLKEDLAKLQVEVPTDKKEQRRIADIINTVEEMLCATWEKIESMQSMKSALLRNLFTKGIAHSRYVDRGIGSIPITWSFVKLSEVAVINREAKDPTMTMANTEICYIDIDAVENGTGKIGVPKRILGNTAPSRARRVVHTDDVIMSTVRPYLKAFAIVPEEYDNQICSTGFAVLSAKSGVVPRYLFYALFTDSVLDQSQKKMIGGQYPAINSTQVGELMIPMPATKEEQEKIASILQAADDKINVEKQKLARFQSIKRGLMDKLLTGRKRAA